MLLKELVTVNTPLRGVGRRKRLPHAAILRYRHLSTVCRKQAGSGLGQYRRVERHQETT